MMRQQKIIGIILLFVICLVLCAGCTTSSDPTQVGSTAIIRPIDYGNGVLYFNCIEAGFLNSLSDFIEHNPSLRILAISGDGNGAYGSDTGYFVVVEER